MIDWKRIHELRAEIREPSANLALSVCFLFDELISALEELHIERNAIKKPRVSGTSGNTVDELAGRASPPVAEEETDVGGLSCHD